MTRGRLLTLILGGLLLAGALLPWLLPANRLVDASLPAAVRSETSAPPPLALQPIESYAAMVERPLFTATRRAAPAGVAPAERNAGLILGRYRLTGVIVTPHKRSILLASAGNRTQTVVQGEAIDGWTLKTVERDRIVLENGGKQEVVPVGKPDTARGSR
jgi:hypothetical protein